MNCQEVMELMQRHVDNDLNDQETSLMMDHVGRCPECAAMLDRLVRLSKGLEQLPRIEPPYSIVDAILPQLAARDQQSQPDETDAAAPKGRRNHRPRQAWITRISGVVAFGVVIAVFAFNGPFFSGTGGGSAQKEASILNESAYADDAAANSLRSEAMSKEMRASEPFGKEMPRADQAPAAAPSAGSPQSGAGSGSSQEAGKLPAADERVEDMKGFAANPAESAVNPPMTFMEAAPDVVEAVSPDGEWKAVLTDGTLQIFRTSESGGTAAFELAADAGTLSELAWQDDGKALNFMYTDADGTVHARSILVPEMKEIER